MKPTRELLPKLLVEILDFYKHKINSGDCTDEDMRTAFELISEKTVCNATVSSVAKFYDQSPSNVRNIISRWGIKGESKRYYDFNKLLKVIPKSWRKSANQAQKCEPKPYADSESNYAMAADSEVVYGKQ